MTSLPQGLCEPWRTHLTLTSAFWRLRKDSCRASNASSCFSRSFPIAQTFKSGKSLNADRSAPLRILPCQEPKFRFCKSLHWKGTKAQPLSCQQPQIGFRKFWLRARARTCRPACARARERERKRERAGGHTHVRPLQLKCILAFCSGCGT